MKKWELQSNFKFQISNFKLEQLIAILLENRGIKSKKEIDDYLNPSLENLTADNLGISKKDLQKSLTRIEKAIKNQEQIIVFGDYDVDGIAGSAILWESLNGQGANVMPYIPHRIDEGYGLSKKGIESVLEKYPQTKLIITVDNGIVANEAVDFANSKNLEVIITDHHQPSESLPKAFALVHSTKICGAAVGWFLSQQIVRNIARGPATRFPPASAHSRNTDSALSGSLSTPVTPRADLLDFTNDHLGLVALATVTDVMSLNGFNRTLVKLGLESLRKTKRPGIIELLKLAGVDKEKIGVYELGFIIGPRLNAMGRIEHAMDSLRFLCTNNLPRAKELANTLHITNRERQQLTFDGVLFAKKTLDGKKPKKLIFISDKSIQPGIIGLVSGRLTEEFYRPSIVVSVSEEFCKGSARSVSGFNVIEFIRQFSDLLEDHGGHPMAAGFTVKTQNLKKLQEKMEKLAEKEIDEKLLIRKLKIDCELPTEFIDFKLFESISKLSPFGYVNPEPAFLAYDLTVENMRSVGAEGKHLKLELRNKNQEVSLPGILFGYDKSLNLKIGNKIDTVYNISLNEWNGNKRLELKIKDVKISISDDL